MLLRLHMLHPMEEPRKTVGSGRETSSGGSMLPFHLGITSQMLVAELRKDASKPFGDENSWINTHFQTVFPNVVNNDRLSAARNTIFLVLNWPTQYNMILSKCLPNMKNVTNTGFSVFHVENEGKTCR